MDQTDITDDIWLEVQPLCAFVRLFPPPCVPDCNALYTRIMECVHCVVKMLICVYVGIVRTRHNYD